MKYLLTFALTLMLAGTGIAAEEWTLERALEAALAGHPDLNAALEEITAAEADARQDGAWNNPALFFHMEGAPRDGDAWNGSERVLGLSQDLPLFGQKAAAGAVGRARAEAAAADRLSLRRELEARVRDTYGRLWLASQNLQLRGEAQALAEQLASIMDLRAETGDASLADAYRARMAAETAALGTGAAEAELRASAAALEALVGQPVASDLSLTEPARPAHGNDARSALLDAADARRRIADAAIRQASRERWPELELEAGLRTSPEGDAFDVGVKLEFPLWDRGGQGLQAARARERASAHRVTSLDRLVSAEVSAAQARLDAAEKALGTCREEIVPRAERVMRAMEQSFAAGDVGLTEVLQVTREWIAAREAELDWLAERLATEAELVRLR